MAFNIEICQALLAYGGLDFRTATAVTRTEKAYTGMLNGDILDNIIAEDTSIPLVWMAKHVGHPTHISGLKAFKYTLERGDRDAVIKLMDVNDLVFNFNRHDDFIKYCFAFDKMNPHLISPLLFVFVQMVNKKSRELRNGTPQESTVVKAMRITLYGLLLRVITNAYMWAFKNSEFVKTLPKGHVFCSKTLRRDLYTKFVMVQQYVRTHLYIFEGRGLYDRMDAICRQAVRVQSAWSFSMSTGKDILIGKKGGLYSILNGKKKYW